VSAGVLLYRSRNGRPEVLLGHPGGPLWARRDRGAWSLPKGEIGPGESPESAARREFEEETGLRLTQPMQPLGQITQRGGKVVHAWAVEADADPAQLRSNSFAMEWPPASGKTEEFPEIDRFEWCGLEEAARRINPGQVVLLQRLLELIEAS